MFSELAIEQQAEVLDPSNNDSCVCALCKRNVARRVHGTRIVCEMPGCLDINVMFEEFRVEDVMIKLCQILDEHKRHSEESNINCCNTKTNTASSSNGSVVVRTSPWLQIVISRWSCSTRILSFSLSQAIYKYKKSKVWRSSWNVTRVVSSTSWTCSEKSSKRVLLQTPAIINTETKLDKQPNFYNPLTNWD